MNLSFFIARRYLVKQKGTFSSFIIKLAIGATALSVAVMIISIAFVSGFQQTISEKMFSFLGHVHIEPRITGYAEDKTHVAYDRQLVATIKQLPHVRQVSPFTQRPAIIQGGGHMEGIRLKGIDEQFHFPPSIVFEGGKINYTDSAYAKEIILSRTTADKLDIQAGDTVWLYFLEQGATLPRIRKVRVAGLFHTGVEEIDKYYGICDIRLLQRINNWDANEITGYQVDLDNERYADTIANEIYANYIEPPLTTNTYKDLYPSIFDWLNLQNVNARIILIIMAIVAIINLATALMILIVEQSRMIGLLSALGMPAKAIRRIFLYHAALISGAGILAGNIIAIGLCLLQLHTGFLKLSEDTYYMKQVPVHINWWQIAVIDIATLLVCTICMWLPALYIRRIKPARVLQFK